MKSCWPSTQSCWARVNAFLLWEPRPVRSSSSARKPCRPASSSVLTRAVEDRMTSGQYCQAVLSPRLTVLSRRGCVSIPGIAATTAYLTSVSMGNKYIWSALLLCLFAPVCVAATATAQGNSATKVITPRELSFVQVSEGVRLKELTGRAAPAAAKSTMCSVALFELDPGHASAWSHNKVGEESFFVLDGHGEVWTGAVAHPVGPGDYILIPPSVVRSIRASKGEILKFYAITTPAWSKDDDVLVPAPKGAPVQ